MKRWHFKYVQGGKLGVMWSEPFNLDGNKKMVALRECLNQLRAVHGLSNAEILDCTCQLVDDPGNN